MRILAIACFNERRRVRGAKVLYIYDLKSSYLKLKKNGRLGEGNKHKGLKEFLGKNRPTLNLLLLSVYLTLYAI
jgi:hypothetical protein